MSDSENTKGHGESVPEEDPERASAQSGQSGEQRSDAEQGLTVDDILDTPQSEDAQSGDARTKGGQDAAPSATTGDAAPAAEDGASRARQLADERLEDLRRLQAEFVNFRNRTAREKDQLREFVAADLVTSLLPVFDDIDAARNAGALADGPFAAIANKLEETLTRQGLTRLGEVGEVFDPNVHEAVLQQPTTEVAPDHVALVLRSGFKMGDRVVRAAQVAVATQP